MQRLGAELASAQAEGAQRAAEFAAKYAAVAGDLDRARAVQVGQQRLDHSARAAPICCEVDEDRLALLRVVDHLGLEGVVGAATARHLRQVMHMDGRCRELLMASAQSREGVRVQVYSPSKPRTREA